MIALMMEAVRTSENSVNFNVTTGHYIPEDSKLEMTYFYETLYENHDIRGNGTFFVNIYSFYFKYAKYS
jgi:hypothetical protein